MDSRAVAAGNARPLFWLKVSLLLQILLAAYFEAIVWLHLGAWNDQPGVRLIDAARSGELRPVVMFSTLIVAPLLAYSIVFWRKWYRVLWLAFAGYAGWALMQVQSWWIPWLFGPNRRALANAHALQRTYKLFPSTAAHLAPDAMHFVLDVLLFAALITMGVGLYQVTLRRR